jgi:hypothetical protein
MEQHTETESVGSYSSAVRSNISSLSNKVPGDKIQLVFLLITGSKASFEFEPSMKIDQVKNFLFEHWPKGNIEVCQYGGGIILELNL